MRTALSLGRLAVVFSMSPLASALVWPRWLPDPNSLIVRQENGASNPPSSPVETAAATANTASSSGDRSGASSGTSSGDDPRITDFNTGGLTNASGNGTRTQKTQYSDAPAGSVVMVTPPPTEPLVLYKMGDHVTWAWNYTNLQGTPTALDLIISASAAGPWTLTANMTIAPTGSFTWDTGAYQSQVIANPLPVDEFTLTIVEAGSSVSATAEAGYLAPFDGFQFGLYTGRPYSPLGEWVCATCSAGVSDMERRGLGTAVMAAIVTTLTFTWFVAGVGASI